MATLQFNDISTEIDGTIGLFRADDTFEVYVLGSTERERRASEVGSGAAVSTRRGDTFPYVFREVDEGVHVRVTQPTVPLELNDGVTLEYEDEHVVKSDTDGCVGDIKFTIKP